MKENQRKCRTVPRASESRRDRMGSRVQLQAGANTDSRGTKSRDGDFEKMARHEQARRSKPRVPQSARRKGVQEVERSWLFLVNSSLAMLRYIPGKRNASEKDFFWMHFGHLTDQPISFSSTARSIPSPSVLLRNNCDDGNKDLPLPTLHISDGFGANTAYGKQQLGTTPNLIFNTEAFFWWHFRFSSASLNLANVVDLSLVRHHELNKCKR